MSYKTIIYHAEDGLAKITINRPEAMNSLNPDVFLEIKAAIEEAVKDHNTGVIVLTGAGDRAFSAGLDLKSLGSIGGEGPSINDLARDLQDTIETAPKAVIAMVNGYCLTGALEIVLACDLIISSEEARFADTHVKWGLRCTWGMSQRLPHRVGEIKAREMTFTGEMVQAAEAERIGLINRAVPASKLEETVKEIAGKIMANSLESVAAHKYLYNQSRKDSIKKGLEREYSTQANISDTLERLTGFGKK